MRTTTQNGSSGVNVETGEPGGVPGGTGDKDSKGTKAGGAKEGTPQGQGDADSWSPGSEVNLRSYPKVLRDPPKVECPAVKAQGLQGTVVLLVQIRGDGSIRRVRVKQGIGRECDQIAVTALKKARFAPATSTLGKPMDFELKYEYEFRLSD